MSAKHSSSKKSYVAVAVVIALVVVGLGVGFATSPKGEPSVVPGSADRVADDARPSQGNEQDDSNPDASSSLPFSLDGADTSALVIEASDITEEVSLQDEWTFGGDYACIGSFPIDATTVFGSSTYDPADVEGYSASFIGPDHVTKLEPRQNADTVFEPQDGTGSSDCVVWRSSELSNLPTNGTDNWRVQMWSSALDKPVTLGSAEALNGTDETPMLDGEILPTANGSNVFFASMAKDGDSWKPEVLSWTLGRDMGVVTVIGEGSYPAAVSDGCLWATRPDYRDSGTFYGSLSSWAGGSSSTVFNVRFLEGTWGISGVWASSGYRAVCLSSDDASRGCYVGIWNDDFTKCLAWIHSDAPRAIASLNSDWLVWGAGSESDNVGMYALRLSNRQAYLLGECVGYSRPSLASSSNAVLVPVTNGLNAVSYRVGTLS